MSDQQILYLSRAEVEEVDLPMMDVITLLERAFKEKGIGGVEMPPKPGIHTMPDAFIHAMPAFISSMRSAGTQMGQRLPGQLQTRPTLHQRSVDSQRCGYRYPVCRHGLHVDYGEAYRCRHSPLGKVSRALGLGNCRDPRLRCAGAQQPGSARVSVPLKRVYAYDVLPEASERYAADMRRKHGLEIEVVKHPRDALVKSDLVVTSGPILKHPSPTIEKDWLPLGAFASAVDS